MTGVGFNPARMTCSRASSCAASSATRHATWCTVPAPPAPATNPPVDRTSTRGPGTPSPAPRGARPPPPRRESPRRARFARRPESQRVHQHPLGGGALLHPDRHRMEAADGVLARNPRRLPPGGPGLGAGIGDQLEHQPIVVTERDRLLSARSGPPPGGPVVPDAMVNQPLQPEPESGREHRERQHAHLSRSLAPAPRPGPREEGQDAAGCAGLVAEVEVVSLRIVEVHCALDEPEAEPAGVEIERALRIARDRGDVMDAQRGGQATTPSLGFGPARETKPGPRSAGASPRPLPGGRPWGESSTAPPASCRDAWSSGSTTAAAARGGRKAR